MDKLTAAGEPDGGCWWAAGAGAGAGSGPDVVCSTGTGRVSWDRMLLMSTGVKGLWAISICAWLRSMGTAISPWLMGIMMPWPRGSVLMPAVCTWWNGCSGNCWGNSAEEAIVTAAGAKLTGCVIRCEADVSRDCDVSDE